MIPTAISWAAKPSAAWETFFAFIAAPLTPLPATEGTKSCLVLPETEYSAAVAVLSIALPSGSERDGDEPPVTVTTGIAVYPHDGKTIDEAPRRRRPSPLSPERLFKKRLPQST